MTTATEPRAVTARVISFPGLPAGGPHLLVELEAETVRGPMRNLYAVVRRLDSWDFYREGRDQPPYSVTATTCDCAAALFNPERYPCKHIRVAQILEGE